jgi:hypothetical protein
LRRLDLLNNVLIAGSRSDHNARSKSYRNLVPCATLSSEPSSSTPSDHQSHAANA